MKQYIIQLEVKINKETYTRYIGSPLGARNFVDKNKAHLFPTKREATTEAFFFIGSTILDKPVTVKVIQYE